MVEEYGFVYLWFDKKHKRFYVGCHWGTENDGYICSSNWMRDAYRRRPDDFKRRVISRIKTNRKGLLKEEYYWLSKIKKEELGKRYYNLTMHHNGHWSTNEETTKSLKEKISNKLKRHFANNPVSEETRAKISKIHKGRIHSEEHMKKISKALKGRKQTDEFRTMRSEMMKGKDVSWLHTSELNSRRSEKLKDRPLSEDHKDSIRKSHVGKKLSQEHREALKASWAKRKLNPNDIMFGK